jgi:hypothetical protein
MFQQGSRPNSESSGIFRSEEATALAVFCEILAV